MMASSARSKILASGPADFSKIGIGLHLAILQRRHRRGSNGFVAEKASGSSMSSCFSFLQTYGAREQDVVLQVEMQVSVRRQNPQPFKQSHRSHGSVWRAGILVGQVVDLLHCAANDIVLLFHDA